MKLQHSRIPERTVELTPLSAQDLAQFPRHSCTLSERQGDKCFYSRLETSQASAIKYCRERGYRIPFGF